MSSLPEIPLAGLVVETVSSTAGMAIVVTGLVAAAFRAAAVLRESSPEQVEWMTSVGFGGGIALAMAFLALDMVVG